MPGPTQALSPNGENNNDIIPDSNGTNIIPYRKNTVRGERAYRYTTAITIRRPLYKETSALSDLQSMHLAENIKITRFNPCFPHALALGTQNSHYGCGISNGGAFPEPAMAFPRWCNHKNHVKRSLVNAYMLQGFFSDVMHKI